MSEPGPFEARPAEYRAEAHHVAKVGGRCEVCGSRLSPREQRDAIESSGRALCRVCALEESAGGEDDRYSD